MGLVRWVDFDTQKWNGVDFDTRKWKVTYMESPWYLIFMHEDVMCKTCVICRILIPPPANVLLQSNIFDKFALGCSGQSNRFSCWGVYSDTFAD